MFACVKKRSVELTASTRGTGIPKNETGKRVCQKFEFINFTLATATVKGVKLSKMDF
jgi:hypothetical protein